MGDYYFPAFFVIGSLAVIAFVVFCCIRRRQQRQQEEGAVVEQQTHGHLGIHSNPYPAQALNNGPSNSDGGIYAYNGGHDNAPTTNQPMYGQPMVGQPVQFNSYTSPYGAGNYSQPSTGTDPIYMDNNVRYGALQSTALYPPPPPQQQQGGVY